MAAGPGVMASRPIVVPGRAARPQHSYAGAETCEVNPAFLHPTCGPAFPLATLLGEPRMVDHPRNLLSPNRHAGLPLSETYT